MHLDFMRVAIEAAVEGTARRDGGPFGAVIVCRGEIVSRAWNRVIRDHDPTAHAEVNAIREACSVLGQVHLEACELYSSCEPCPMCLSAIYWARLGRVYYAATREDADEVGFCDAELYRELARDPRERSIPFIKMELSSAVNVMRDWKSDPTQQLY